MKVSSLVSLSLSLVCAAAALWAWSPGPGRLSRLRRASDLGNGSGEPRASNGERHVCALRRRRSPPAVPVSELLLALELLAAALDAGAPPASALETVGGAIGGGSSTAVSTTLSTALRQVALAMRLGADARSAWHDVPLAQAGNPLAGLARAMARVDEGGARVAASLRRLAAREEERAHGRALAAARRAGVFAVAPLGFCFLPAFVLLAVVPVVVGAAHQVLLP